jgi:hypothetical protein
MSCESGNHREECHANEGDESIENTPLLAVLAASVILWANAGQAAAINRGQREMTAGPVPCAGPLPIHQTANTINFSYEGTITLSFRYGDRKSLTINGPDAAGPQREPCPAASCESARTSRWP